MYFHERVGLVRFFFFQINIREIFCAFQPEDIESKVMTEVNQLFYENCVSDLTIRSIVQVGGDLVMTDFRITDSKLRASVSGIQCSSSVHVFLYFVQYKLNLPEANKSVNLKCVPMLNSFRK